MNIALRHPTVFTRIVAFSGRYDLTESVGSFRGLFENNLRLTEILTAKAIPHDFYIWDGEAHRPRYWRPMARLYL